MPEPRRVVVSAILLTAALRAQVPQSTQAQPTPSQQKLSQAYIQLRKAPDLPVPSKISIGKIPRAFLNAFALRDTQEVYVDETLIQALWNDQEALSFVLAHEFGHLLVSNCQASDKALVLREITGAVAGGIANGIGGVLGGMQASVHRICEEQADVDAVHYMREAGMDPAAGYRLFDVWERYTNSATYHDAAAYLSADHPISPERRARLGLAIANQKIPDLVP